MIFQDSDKYKDAFGIYCITNLVNGMQYIGQTGERFQRRFWHHRWKLNHNSHDNKHLQAAFNKYGPESFVFSVLEVCSTTDELDDLEIRYIGESPSSYNMLGGGGGRRGRPMGENAKKIIGEKNREYMTGRVHNEQTRRKMSQTRTGQLYTRHKRTNVIDEHIAQIAKERLVSGTSVTQTAQELCVPRGVIANIVTNNTWDCVYVDGWDEFRNTRPVSKRLHKKDVESILNEYNNGASLHQLAMQYNRTERELAGLIGRHT